MSRDEQGHLTAEKIQAELKSIEPLRNQPDPAPVEIDRALGGNQPFENALENWKAQRMIEMAAGADGRAWADRKP